MVEENGRERKRRKGKQLEKGTAGRWKLNAKGRREIQMGRVRKEKEEK